MVPVQTHARSSRVILYVSAIIFPVNSYRVNARHERVSMNTEMEVLAPPGSRCGARIHYDHGPWLAFASKPTLPGAAVMYWTWEGPAYHATTQTIPRGAVVLTCTYHGARFGATQRFAIIA